MVYFLAHIEVFPANQDGGLFVRYVRVPKQLFMPQKLNSSPQHGEFAWSWICLTSSDKFA